MSTIWEMFITMSLKFVMDVSLKWKPLGLYDLTVWVWCWPHDCSEWMDCSINPLIITANTLLLIARGPRNMHRVFPDPMTIRTNTSWPCSIESDASNWPGRKEVYPKYFWRDCEFHFTQTVTSVATVYCHGHHQPLDTDSYTTSFFFHASTNNSRISLLHGLDCPEDIGGKLWTTTI